MDSPVHAGIGLEGLSLNSFAFMLRVSGRGTMDKHSGVYVNNIELVQGLIYSMATGLSIILQGSYLPVKPRIVLFVVFSPYNIIIFTLYNVA